MVVTKVLSDVSVRMGSQSALLSGCLILARPHGHEKAPRVEGTSADAAGQRSLRASGDLKRL
jgi:hypothetical protein